MAALYPVFLKLDGLSVFVVGGGPVAASKLEGLLAAGARITIVAPQVVDAIRAHASVTILETEFRAEHLHGARWVVAAATPDVNRDVAAAAAARGLFVNAVDEPGNATAYLGGIVRRGDVEIAISTGGTAPGLAGLLREALDAILPHDLEKWIAVAAVARREWKRDGIVMAERRPMLMRALERLYRPKPQVAS
ncbi:hypothetical protein BH11MYX1_BH11MYX1_12400 [soil metagenome]